MTYGPPGPYGHYGPPPVFAPTPVIRPSLGWVAGAWVAAVVLGAAAFVYGLVGLFTTTAEGLMGSAPTSLFSSGQSVTVTLDPAQGPGVYSDNFPYKAECQVEGGTAEPAASHVTFGNGKSWSRKFDLEVPAKGDYQVTCTAKDYAGQFGIGRSAAADEAAMSAGNTVNTVVMLGVPVALLAVAGAVNVALVVARGRYRRSLRL